MSKKGKQDQHDREGIGASLLRWSRGRIPPPPGAPAGTYVPPSRKNRKSITTWQDEAALKELRAISGRTGISQQALIAEGLNYVLTKYRERAVAR
jgi:hypothetical protein